MSQTRKVVLAAISLIVLLIAAVPIALFALSVVPALWVQLANADERAVFVAVAGAFGFAFVLSVPRQR